MKRILPLLLVFLLLLSACAPAKEPEPDSPQSPPSSETGSEGGESKPNPDPDPNPAPVLPYQHPLTGEALAEPLLNRPVAVMLNNIKQAMPQHGVSQADILYEVLAEGGITRCMGIYTDLQSVEKIGSIRSARKYFVDLARAYDAGYVHAGGSSEARNYLNTLKNVDLDAGMSATYFYRDQDRLNAGYSMEHTLFSSGEMILAFAQQRGVTTRLEQPKTYNMTFDGANSITGQAAQKVSVFFNISGAASSWTKATIFSYDQNTNTYFAAQAGGASHPNGEYVDGNTNKTIAFRNVLVLRAETFDQMDDSHHLTVNTVGSGTGYFACNGSMVSIKWSRASAGEPFTFTLENGTPLTFGVGTTYIAVVPTGATVNFE